MVANNFEKILPFVKMELLLSAKDCQLNSRPWGLAQSQTYNMNNTTSWCMEVLELSCAHWQHLVTCRPIDNPPELQRASADNIAVCTASRLLLRFIMLSSCVVSKPTVIIRWLYYSLNFKLFTVSANRLRRRWQWVGFPTTCLSGVVS